MLLPIGYLSRWS